MATPTRNPFGLMATPALDLTPTGHLPYMVKPRQPVDQLAAEGAREYAEQAERITAALPEAIDQALKNALPERYTPELAARMAEVMAAEMRLTPAQSTLVRDEGMGALTTVPVETALRDIDCEGAWDSASNMPWLAARVVVHDEQAQAYGRKTQVWLDYGVHTGELTPAKARDALEAMRGFVARLEAVVELAEETAAGDFEGDPEVARLDREAEDRRLRAITEGRA